MCLGAVFRCRYDACFSILDANDGFFEFLNYTRKEFEDMGNRFFSVIHPEDVDALRGKLGAGLADGNTINNDNRVICKGGEVKWVSLKAQMLKEETGEQYFYCVFVDITEEKAAAEPCTGALRERTGVFCRTVLFGREYTGKI